MKDIAKSIPTELSEAIEILDGLTNKHVTIDGEDLFIFGITWDMESSYVTVFCKIKSIRLLFNEIIPALKTRIETPIGFLLPKKEKHGMSLKPKN